MVGAFLAGAVMDASWFDQRQLDELRHNVLLLGGRQAGRRRARWPNPEMDTR